MKGFKSIPVKFKPTPITIKEPYKPDVKEFADTDDFTAYFRANEELFKEPSDDPDKQAHFLTTNKLNRTYKIPGYRIRIINKGKDNEELTLVKDYYSRTNDNEPLNETISASTPNGASAARLTSEQLVSARWDTANDKIVEMEQSIADIVERINNIESFLMQLKR